MQILGTKSAKRSLTVVLGALGIVGACNNPGSSRENAQILPLQASDCRQVTATQQYGAQTLVHGLQDASGAQLYVQLQRPINPQAAFEPAENERRLCTLFLRKEGAELAASAGGAPSACSVNKAEVFNSGGFVGSHHVCVRSGGKLKIFAAGGVGRLDVYLGEALLPTVNPWDAPASAHTDEIRACIVAGRAAAGQGATGVTLSTGQDDAIIDGCLKSAKTAAPTCAEKFNINATPSVSVSPNVC